MSTKNIAKSVLAKYQERCNKPSFLSYVAGTVAQFKGISLQVVAEETSKNATAFFDL